MLLQDGTLVCYRIEKFVDGEWFSGWHQFWMDDTSYKIDPVDNCRSSGQCWQQARIFGFFNVDNALRVCDMAREYWKGQFRVVRLEIVQRRTVVRQSQAGYFSVDESGDVSL